MKIEETGFEFRTGTLQQPFGKHIRSCGCRSLGLFEKISYLDVVFFAL